MWGGVFSSLTEGYTDALLKLIRTSCFIHSTEVIYVIKTHCNVYHILTMYRRLEVIAVAGGPFLATYAYHQYHHQNDENNKQNQANRQDNQRLHRQIEKSGVFSASLIALISCGRLRSVVSNDRTFGGIAVFCYVAGRWYFIKGALWRVKMLTSNLGFFIYKIEANTCFTLRCAALSYNYA